MPPRQADSPGVRNRLLLELPPSLGQSIVDAAELVPIAVGDVLQEPSHHPEHVIFPNGGVASIVALMRDGTMIEAAIVGIDGFCGTSVMLGHPSTTRVIWQVPGDGYRIPSRTFATLVDDHGPSAPIYRYLQVLSDQMAQVAGCNRRHSIRHRAARWLLMTDDRVESDSFMLTQEFLATMLGVGRPKVTIAAQHLQDQGLIRYRRGVITITDREGLEAVSCECYQVLAGAFPGS
jgi:CRP-like cAMP-binding protein